MLARLPAVELFMYFMLQACCRIYAKCKCKQRFTLIAMPRFKFSDLAVYPGTMGLYFKWRKFDQNVGTPVIMMMVR